MSAVDIEKIKNLDAYQVGVDLGLIEFKGGRRDRMGWVGEGKGDDYSYLQFFPETNSYYDHRRGIGGSCIDLVMQGLHPSKQKTDLMKWTALSSIATHYGLWADPAPFAEKAEKLAGIKSHYRRPFQYVKDGLQSIIQTRRTGKSLIGFDSQIRESGQLWDALGIDPKRITLSAQVMSNGGALCWQPAVPWQGAAHHSKYDEETDEHRVTGGWTKELAVAHIQEPESLRFFIVDLDGAGRPVDCPPEQWNKEANIPRFDLTLRLVSELARRGLTCRAHVISSWGQDRSRCKSHLYFAAKRQARTVEEFVRWHRMLREEIAHIWGSWKDVEEQERFQFEPDQCTDQITRLVRIPGFAKSGKQFAGVLFASNPESSIDFQTRTEKRDHHFDHGQNAKWHLGEFCYKEELKPDNEGGGEWIMKPFAHNVYPLQVYQTVEDGQTGVRYRYTSRTGRESYAVMSAAAFNNRNDGRRHCAEASAQGVRILTNTGNLLASALGHWSDGGEAEKAFVTKTPGWHEEHKIYINGDRVYGAHDWFPDEQDPAIQRRSHKGGTLSEWKKGVKKLMTTPGLKLALGHSLAGALISVLGLSSFTLHLCGDSSKGKSCAARVAAAVWGSEQAAFNSWDATAIALQNLAQTFSGGCLVLDEFDTYKAKDEKAVGDIMYTIGGDKGRARSNRDGSTQVEKAWKLTVLSTGEISGADRLGAMEKGGHKVRFIDIFVRDGDLATSKEHAEKLESFARTQFGHAGDAWVSWLIENQETAREVFEYWQRKAGDTYVGDTEGGRIFNNLCIIFTALTLAENAGLVDWTSDELHEVFFAWCLTRLGERDGKSTPNERGINLFYRLMLNQPSRFPPYEDRHKHKDVIAYRWKPDTGTETEEVLLTTKEMIQASTLPLAAGINPGRWFKWLRNPAEKGGAGVAKQERLRIDGRRLTFTILPTWNPLQEDELEEEANAPERF